MKKKLVLLPLVVVLAILMPIISFADDYYQASDGSTISLAASSASIVSQYVYGSITGSDYGWTSSCPYSYTKSSGSLVWTMPEKTDYFKGFDLTARYTFTPAMAYADVGYTLNASFSVRGFTANFGGSDGENFRLYVTDVTNNVTYDMGTATITNDYYTVLSFSAVLVPQTTFNFGIVYVRLVSTTSAFAAVTSLTLNLSSISFKVGADADTKNTAKIVDSINSASKDITDSIDNAVNEDFGYEDSEEKNAADEGIAGLADQINEMSAQINQSVEDFNSSIDGIKDEMNEGKSFVWGWLDYVPVWFTALIVGFAGLLIARKIVK